jgi:hypothetical protein
MSGDVLPGDWIEIELLRNGIAFPICLGIVETVNRDRQSIRGASRVHWQISGKDHGGFFERPITYSNVYAQTLGEVVNGMMYARVRGATGGTPAELFKLLIEAAVSKGTTGSIWRLPKSLAEAKGITTTSGNILDILDINNRFDTRGAYYNDVQLWNKAGQSLDQLLSFWCFPLMHQMVYDVADPDNDQLNSSYPIMAVIRERPYINLDEGLDSDWFELPTWRIPSWLPVRDNFARADMERFNIVQLLSNVGWQGGSSEQTAVLPPSYARSSVERFGLRPATFNTHFLPSSAPNLGEFISFRSSLQDTLTEWHAANPYFLSGNVHLGMPIPEARVGHRLQLDNGTESEMLTFFIEGVGLNYQASESPEDPPIATSDLTLTRGYIGTDQDGLDLVQRAAGMYSDLPFRSR